MADAVKDLRGVTPELTEKLREKGIRDVDQFLQQVKTPQGRRDLAKELGLELATLLELANRADLARIKGVSGVYSDLLENAGVDTVKELARRKPENLLTKLLEVNEKLQLTKRPPRAEQVDDWVKQAGELPPGLEY